MGRRAEGLLRPAWGSFGQAALLAVSILSFGFPLTQARDINVSVSPPQVLEGEGITLTPEGSTAFLVCMWYRGPSQDEATRIFSYLPSPTPMQQNGSSFSERETAGPDCSLHIKSVMLSDTGTYTVSKIGSDCQPEIGHGHLEVLGKEQVLLGRDATLTPEGSTDFLVCMWYRGPSQDEATRIFSYLPSPTPMQQNGSSFSERETAGPDCSLRIKSVMLSDNGTYTVTKIGTDGYPEIGHVHLEVKVHPSHQDPR